VNEDQIEPLIRPHLLLPDALPESDVRARAIPDPVARSSRGADPNRIHHYYVPPFSTAHNNGCGQAAMATILTYWGKMAFNPGNAEALYNDPTSNPDIVWGLFGTSWERFQKVCASRGLTAYGQNEPRLTVNSEQGKFETLKRWVDARCPVAVILGNGELGLGFGAHWGIVTDITAQSVMLANYGNGYYPVGIQAFMKAWMSYGLPGVHYAGVFAQG
jgi:hypothetical protein